MVLAVIVLLYAAAAVMHLAINRKSSGAAALIVAAAPVGRRQSSSTPALKPLLEPAQQLFYGALKQALTNSYEIFIKIRVADILPTPAFEWRNAANIGDFTKIRDQYFDFVICHPQSLAVVAAIRLNEADQPASNGCEKMIRTACKRQKISFIALKAKASYDIESIKKLIDLLKK